MVVVQQRTRSPSRHTPPHTHHPLMYTNTLRVKTHHQGVYPLPTRLFHCPRKTCWRAQQSQLPQPTSCMMCFACNTNLQCVTANVHHQAVFRKLNNCHVSGQLPAAEKVLAVLMHRCLPSYPRWLTAATTKGIRPARPQHSTSTCTAQDTRRGPTMQALQPGCLIYNTHTQRHTHACTCCRNIAKLCQC